MGHFQLYAMALALMALFCVSLIWQEYQVMFGVVPASRWESPSLDFLSLTLLLILLPLPLLQPSKRKALVMNLLVGLASPFTEVRFATFFMYDVLASASLLVADSVLIACYLTQPDWATLTQSECPAFVSVGVWLALIPIWVRMMQCARRFYDDSSNRTQAYNFAKYLSTIVSSVLFIEYASSQNPTTFRIAFCTRILATLYSYSWDIYIDWGLLQERSGLRETLTFPKAIYYQAVFTNLILRFAWTVPFLTTTTEPYCYLNSFGYSTWMATAELFRRWQWAILRIENE